MAGAPCSCVTSGNIRMDMDGVERLDLTALGGVDTMTVDDMTGTDFRQADVDLSASTGGGDGLSDTVTVNGTDRADRIDVGPTETVVDVAGLRTTVESPAASPSIGSRSTVSVATTRSTSIRRLST